MWAVMKKFQIKNFDKEPENIKKFEKAFMQFNPEQIVMVLVGNELKAEKPYFVEIPFDFDIDELIKKLPKLTLQCAKITNKVTTPCFSHFF
jgi:hypothetical protein